MEREIIKVTEFDLIPLVNEDWKALDEYQSDSDEEILISGIWEDFDVISDELEYFDLEDQYYEELIIIKRKSDNKYFKFKSIFSEYHYKWSIENPTLIEVFPKQKTITVYE